MVFTETWLYDGIFDSELCDPRYEVFRSDRDSVVTGRSMGGGVMICVRRGLSAYYHHEWHCSAIETLWVTIPAASLRASNDLHLAAVYIRGNDEHQHNNIDYCFSKLADAVNRNINDSFLVLGDFNLSNISWTDIGPIFQKRGSIELQNSGYNLVSGLSLFGLTQFNTLKNPCGNTLDLAFSNFTIDLIRADDPLIKEDIFHPSFILDATDITVEPLQALPALKHKYSKGDYGKIFESLNSVNWDSDLSVGTLDDAVHFFYEHIKVCINTFVPKVATHKRHNYPIWYSASLIKIIREKSKAHARWKKFKNPLDYSEFRLLRTRQDRVHDACLKRYIREMETKIKLCPKKFWSYVKSRRRASNYPGHVTYHDHTFTDGVDICSAFNDFFYSVFIPPADHYDVYTLPPASSNPAFDTNSIILTESDILKALKNLDCSKGAGSDKIPPSFISRCGPALSHPLCLIYNRSLREGTFPRAWKEALIVPIHKKNSKIKVEHYRPISILNTFAKLFEKLVFNSFYQCLSHSIPEEQHGFLRGRSTITNLAVFVDSVLNSMEQRRQVDVVYTDFEKAFDRVDHFILLRKLDHLGIHGDLLRWVKSYLSRRSQAVVVGGFRSNFVNIPSGVPQGSHLGPLLYIAYLYDVHTCFRHSRYSMYADDTKIYTSVNNIDDCTRLQEDLDRLAIYYDKNRIKVNADKCQSITFTRKTNIIEFTYKIQNTPIERVHLVRDLGVYLDSKLNMIEHIDIITNKAYKSLGFVMRTCKPFSDTACIKNVYYAYVRSILEYASCIWSPNYITHKQDIERIQRKFIKHLNFKTRTQCNSYEAGCAHHKLLSLCNRRTLLDMMLLYDIARSRLDCPALVSQLALHVPQRRTRHTHFKLFHEPNHRTNYAHNSVLSRLPRTYNKQFSSVDPYNLTRNSFRCEITKMLDVGTLN